MFAPISAILAFLFLAPALPNGIRLVELPAEGESVEILAGYGFGGLTALSSTHAARSLELAAYATGGDIQFFEEIDRTGFRIKAPAWALPMFTDELTALFKEVPQEPGPKPHTSDDFRARVEDEIRNALIGSIREFPEYATYRAFLLISGPIPETLRANLAAIPSRGAKEQLETPVHRLPAERTLRFKSDLSMGAVIFAAPSPGVYYREWYSLLLLDQLIHRILPMSPATALPLTLQSNYYRLELSVPAGQFPEPVEENLLQEIQRLQFARAGPMDLEAARREARSYLESKYVREWFESHGLAERREEGLQWVQAMNADDMRVAARDLLIGNRVIATWAPKAKLTTVEVEDLNGGPNLRPSPGPSGPSGHSFPGGEAMTLPISQFPEHKDSRQPTSLPERLASGVSIVTSDANGVFVSGGPLNRFEREPDAEMLKGFQKYRADRILVLAHSASIDRARRLWSSFKGSDSGEAGVPKGGVSTGDLPALVILKVMLDRKLIEAGWWHDVELRISASEGSSLQIRADAEKRTVILGWIKQIASEKPPDTELTWAIEVAIHRFATVRADLQALTWERDPQGAIQDLETVGAGHVSDVARIYF